MSDLITKHLTVFGAGSFGSVLIQRFLQSGIPEEQLTVCDPDRKLANATAHHFGIRLVCTADQAICEADALLLALSEKDSLEILQKITSCLFPHVLVISFSSLAISKIEALLRPQTPVARIKSGEKQGSRKKKQITYGKEVKPEDHTLAEEILTAIGDITYFDDNQREGRLSSAFPGS